MEEVRVREAGLVVGFRHILVHGGKCDRGSGGTSYGK